MRTHFDTARVFGPGLLILSLAACTTQEGEEGNFFFKYEHPGVWAFGTDVAVGHRVDVGVYADEDATEAVPVDQVELTEEAFAAEDVTTDGFTLEAVASGEAELSVTSGDVHDHVDITADPVTALSWHVPDPFGVSGEVGVFAAGGTALIPFDLKNGEELLIGYGVTGVTADPPANATIADQVPFADVYFVHVDFETAGAVTLDHALSDPLALTVVDPTAITAVEWNDFGATTVSIGGMDTPLFLAAEVTDGTLVFGLEGLADVVTTTPGTCRVNPSDLWGDGVYEVGGTYAGDCTITGTVNGHTATWTGEVQAGG